MRQQEQKKNEYKNKKDADVSEAPPTMTVVLTLPVEVTNNAETFLPLLLLSLLFT